MPISENVRRRMAEGSWIRRMFEEGNVLKQQYGEDKVFDLSLGNPVVDPPEELRHELRKLAHEPKIGMHRYMENAGYYETREAVAKQVSKENGIHVTPHDIIMTVGAAGAINIILKSILNPLDEVIVFAPFFMEYDNYIDNHGGKIKIVNTGKDFLPDLTSLEKAINEKTKAVIINSPNNPSGVVYNRKFLEQLTAILINQEKKLHKPIYLISDEAYSSLIYDGLPYVPILQLYHRALIATSHSKDLALPGERIGYVVIHPDTPAKKELLDALIFSNRILGFVNAPALMQHLIRHLQHITVSIEEYQKKRDFIYTNLVSFGYKLVKPEGAFYIFPESPIKDEVEFIRVLQKWNVLTVPGRGFGMPGYFRISYCVTQHTLEGALLGLKKVAEQYHLQ